MHSTEEQNHEKDTVQHSQHHSLRRRLVGFFLILRPQIKGDHRVDTHAEAHCYGGQQILRRIDQRQRRHGILAQFRYEITVHNVVEGIECHGQHHRKCHRHYQREYFLFFHVSLIHFVLLSQFIPIDFSLYNAL